MSFVGCCWNHLKLLFFPVCWTESGQHQKQQIKEMNSNCSTEEMANIRSKPDDKPKWRQHELMFAHQRPVDVYSCPGAKKAPSIIYSILLLRT